ncbi:hypothetical protein [Serratia marcescens]|uniref:hypothetical protein n=1 Tax=Serratia marcescens TaxID=615 RepID=UPI00124AD5EE|nr:hypothetical protein [Serratia marcescens]KAB1579644.1 hypothetical protein F7687_16800 [Serratia marcescens]
MLTLSPGLSFALHQCVGPGLLSLLLIALLVPVLLVLLQVLFDASGSRPGFWRWLREWGAPALLTTAGLVLLLTGSLTGEVHDGLPAEPALALMPPPGVVAGRVCCPAGQSRAYCVCVQAAPAGRAVPP